MADKKKSHLLRWAVFAILLFAVPACGAELAAEECGDLECTSWLVFHDLTQDGTNFLHKTRDATSKTVIPIKSQPDAPRQWIGLGDKEKRNHVLMGLNASGLAIVINGGEMTVEEGQKRSSASRILELCLAECDTAEQAAKKLAELMQNGPCTHGKKGLTYLVMDTREAFIAEMSARHMSVTRYDHGYAVRANVWHNPGMAEITDQPVAAWLDSCNREYMAIHDLNAALRKSGKITIADMLAIARDATSPKDSPMPRTICCKSTNSASTLEISREYPDVLSTGYFLIGPPRHTICVPVPVCVEKFPPCMTDGSWSAAAWKSCKKAGYNAPLPSAWQAFETRSLAEYQAAQKQAETLLKNGRRGEAVKLLNHAAEKIWAGAAKLMKLDAAL